MRPPFLPTAALAALILFAASAACSQTLGGLLNRAKAGATQAARATPTQAGPVAPGSTGPIPDSPPTNGLTVENQQTFARAVLANHRPWALGEHVGDDDYFYRYLRDEDHVPLKFSWDQGFVQFITPKGRYLWFTIEDMCTVLQPLCDAKNTTFLAKMRKVREIHLTTTDQPLRASDIGYGTGYRFSFDPATGVLTAAGSTIRGISNFSSVDNDLANFIQSSGVK